MSRWVSIPTTSTLPSHLRVDSSNATLSKSLSRLSRAGLISLALSWLNQRNFTHSYPHLKRRRRHGAEEEEDEESEEDPDDLYPPYSSVEELQQFYTDMEDQKGSKREAVSRILEGDWRNGLTLYQLATVDMAYFEEHPASQTWTAYQILKLEDPSQDKEEGDVLKVEEKSLKIPRFHPSTFLQNLQTQALPDAKAHYHFYRPKDFPVLLLRIFILESPYNSNLALSGANSTGTGVNFDSSRTVYLAFPDGSPSLFVSKATSSGAASISTEGKSWQTLIVNGVPKALSRPRERFTLKATGLVSKNVSALLERRGTGRSNAAAGGWSIFADEKQRGSPLDTVLPPAPLADKINEANQSSKRLLPLSESERIYKKAKVLAEARFGGTAIVSDGKGVEKLEVVVQDPFHPPQREDTGANNDDESNERSATERRRKASRKSQISAALSEDLMDIDQGNAQPQTSRWAPSIRVSFRGRHVFAGLRQLVEAGIIDGERMPGWMTGEEGVTAGVVKDGRIRGHKGSGI